jgi:hypothetical protein
MGAQFLIPMAASLGFGVIFATAISLFVLPCSYLILPDLAGSRSGPSDREAALAGEGPSLAPVLVPLPEETRRRAAPGDG